MATTPRAPAGPAENAAGLLRRHGQRVTQPRVAVLHAILAAGQDHLSADDVITAMLGADPPVHRATVYRTLELLTAAGVLRHVHLERGLAAYHVLDRPAGATSDGIAEPKTHTAHLHAQCHRCGSVVDLPEKVLGRTAARVRDLTGFHLQAAHVALSGLCADCAHEPSPH